MMTTSRNMLTLRNSVMYVESKSSTWKLIWIITIRPEVTIVYILRKGKLHSIHTGDLRKYMHMWKLQNENANKAELNWLLHIDERTILTQDQSKIDLTRNNLKAKQPILGDSYSKRIREISGVNWMLFLCVNSSQMTEIFSDINRNRWSDQFQWLVESSCKRFACPQTHTFRTSISEYIDDFTFKILSNIERDME